MLILFVDRVSLQLDKVVLALTSPLLFTLTEVLPKSELPQADSPKTAAKAIRRAVIKVMKKTLSS
ncbi:MAG: hypothetical protein AAGB32_04340 [Pseudomonadota bacterium]